MLETAIAAGTVALFAALVIVVDQVPLLSLITVSVWMIVFGMALGLPSGAGYHLAMHRALRASGLQAPGWWWSPVRYHGRLERQAYARVRPWFYAGVCGAGIALAGCGVMTVCYFRMQG